MFISAKINRLAKEIGYSAACKELNRRSQRVRGCKIPKKSVEIKVEPVKREIQRELNLFIEYL